MDAVAIASIASVVICVVILGYLIYKVRDLMNNTNSKD